MPSPLGHALGGFAAGWLVAGPAGADGRVEVAGRRSWRRRVPVRALAFAALGTAADLDLLIGRHSQFTHSLGMTLAVGVAAFAWLSARRIRVQPDATGPGRLQRARWLLAVSVAAAYGSHVLLDWLAQDATPPRGITALWPLSAAYYLSGLDLFAGISRQPWRPGAAWHDLLAVTREILLLGPIALGAWWLRRRRAAQILPAATRRSVQQLPSRPRLPAGGESR